MPFIETLDGQQSRPPYLFRNIVNRSFLLTGDLFKLQDYCDTFLNLFDPYFLVASPLVYLSIVTYPDMRVAGAENGGFTHQNEYFLMFPVVRCDRWGPFLVPDEVTWVFPFIGVDNPTSAIAGQAVIGFPKTCGKIEVTTAPDGSFAGTVAMPGFKTLGPTSEEEVLPIVGVTTGPPLGVTGGPSAPGPSSLAAALIAQATGADAGLLDLITDLIGDLSTLSTIALKQIRSATDPSEAEVQHLLRGEWALSNERDWTVWDGAQVTITDNATTRIAEALGLGVSGQPTPALSAFSLTYDMTNGNFTG